jgi:UDP-N-acetylmuramoyl-L-alanyl-D-glutamate--2,6-diaminopimelate ligase
VRLGTLLAAAGLDAGVALARPAGQRGAAVLRRTGAAGPDLSPRSVDDPEVNDLVISSDQVSQGALFACVPGNRADGHDYALDAVRRGAVALLCQRLLDVQIPQVVVPSVRRALGPVSAALWGSPSAKMRVTGVTGTNGKTTTCALLAAIFEAHGWQAGVIGTLTGERTTPEAPDLQRRLAALLDDRTDAVAMEVSSHALDQGRVDGAHFAAGVFTNLSQDHLDYHVTMESYFGSKARLFTSGQVEVAVVNRDGPWGARLVDLLTAAGARFVTYAPGDATEVVIGRSTSSFKWRGQQVSLKLPGRFNVMNALAAATAASELGIDAGTISRGLAAASPVRGRFQAVEEGQAFSVVIDFAHTPAALAETLKAARELASLSDHAGEDQHRVDIPGGVRGRVIVVFGAGGERDRSKRPLMGRVARELADIVVITSDNPRSEKPLAIIEEVARGARGPYLLEEDRARAITRALEMAETGDVVLIAGKGHETGQDFGSHVEPFDDFEEARKVLRRLRSDQQVVGPAPLGRRD